MGHALDQTMQDVLTRWRRLQGYSALWMPGTDHASIATEVKVADEIYATEGKTKDDLGREEFLNRAWQWKELYGGKITEQQRRLGNSCDWERERFTMDEGCNKAVVEFFVRLYEKGLIYKGRRLINWCPVCGTTLSDAEVEHEDLEGKYWYIRYPAPDGGEGITVATSRPETMFADVCVAVSPDDERYKDMIGKTVLLPITGKELPVIADSYPDPGKGTGAVKITPAHDPNDFEVGERHGLAQPVCIDFDAKMTAEAGEYEGLDRFECRERWIAALDAAGYVVKTETVVIPTGQCYRCDAIVEPMISEQWFVSMKELAKPALAAVKNGELTIVPQHFEKIYIRWLEEIRDWCISRQLWWGHRIPAWYCEACGDIVVARETPEACPKCGAGADALRQDEDVLDTWFSSGLWPFSTLGWPEDTPELKYFFPTNVLVTGYDILFFWVVRMVFSSYEVIGKSPFEYTLFHGIVRDEQGRKMSKSAGNGVDPLEVIDMYGADALRFFLLFGSAAGSDMRFISKNVEATRNFANKLWNAARFVIMNLDSDLRDCTCPELSESERALPADLSCEPLIYTNTYLTQSPSRAPTKSREATPRTEPKSRQAQSPYESLRDEDKWILAKCEAAAEEMTQNLERFELSLATQKIHDFIRDEYCDWYIELVKPRLYGDDEEEKAVCRAVLVHVLSDLLRLLHPFMPFITEEIWGSLGKPGKLIRDKWPVPQGLAKDESFMAAVKKIEAEKEIIRAVRNIRADAGAAPSRRFPIIIKTDADADADVEAGHIMNLAGVSEVRFEKDETNLPEEAASAILEGLVVYVPLEELLDFAAERERLVKERGRLEGEIARLDAKLSNEGFTAKAPAEVVAAERVKLETAEEALEKVLARLTQIEDK